MSLTILIPIVIVLLSFLRQVNQYERGVKFTMGRYTKTAEPGWRMVVPVFQMMKKVDLRTKAVDVPDQESLTRDNVPIKVNAVIYYRIKDAAKAIIEVENYFYAIQQLAQTTMRNAVGEVTLDELLSSREKVAERIKLQIDTASDPWGIDVLSVELKDIILTEELKRTISKQAEAEREKRAVITVSEGEVAAAANIAQAAAVLSAVPGALHIRTLQAINNVSSDESNTIIFATPLEVLKAFEGFTKKKDQ